LGALRLPVRVRTQTGFTQPYMKNTTSDVVKTLLFRWFNRLRLIVSVHPPPLTPPTRGGGKTFPPPWWGRSGGGAELLRL